MYVFIRTDLPVNHQIVQHGHAIYQMVMYYRPDQENPNHVTIGVPNVAALRRVLKKLSDNQIPHYAWSEPDNDMGLTSIATIPLVGEERKPLANYRTYAPVAQLVQSATLPSSGGIVEMDVRIVPGAPFV